ncbi:serine/threonine protein kinase [Lysobacter sp. K5869]|uniref:serine/threonine-protein kinase n=1 Tax=Lysobacter sp. K5869 TaxID=2820808 RepID=UPI001C063A6B|nr:serine/threonine-protein kinase [Lysobacter sp. K5869]QWP74828.1 serine/threonine protein kinase [Lysobacter sp. K5869]
MSDALARALRLFDDYADLPAPERERRLAALAASDPPLHAALRALLDSDAAEDAGVLDRSPAQIVAERQPRAAAAAPNDGAKSDEGAESDEDDEDGGADLRVGGALGPWRIERILGRGGMGTVYEAHRDDGEFQQRVAIKCIRSGLESPELAAAFREERNLLARLDHPGIAGGTDADGRPWFALRRVEGEPIDAWCERRRLSVGARVDLLLQACDALAYAHAQGVLHRDIKPSNLLVTAEGRVQLLDFGISTRFGGEDGASAHLAVTPDYAAPEARQHGTHGPATDLYMLGVLSYRLLCGQWPTRLHSLRELVPIAAAGAPEPMERLLEGADGALARGRGLDDVPALQRVLAGDLSAVALKAVAARPQDRYPSVAEFARDLRAWREHRPVSVRRGGWRERARKWRRRHPAAGWMIAALFAVALAGGAAVLWQHQRALREARAAQNVGRLFASILGSATQSGLGSVPFSSRALLERTERELRAMPLADQPGLRARSLATLARGYAVIGDYRRAEGLAGEAERVLGDREDDDGFVAATRLSMLNLQARSAQAERLAGERIAALDGRDDEAARASRIVFGAELAQAQWNLGRTAQALATCDDLVLQAERLGRSHEELLAQTLILRSEFQRRLWRAAGAEADARRAMRLARPLNPVLADDALERYMRAVQLRGAAEAPALAAELVHRRIASLGASHPKTAYAMIRADVFDSPDQPSYDLGRALASIRAAYGADNPAYASALSTAASRLARDGRERRALMREGAATLEKTMPAESEMRLSATFNLAQDLIRRPDADARRDRAEGFALLRRNIDARRRAGLPTVLEGFLLIDGLSDYGDDAALPELGSRLDEWQRELAAVFPPDNYRFDYLRFQRAKLDFRRGRYDEAGRGFAELLERERAFLAADGRGDGALTDQHQRSGRAVAALMYRGLLAFARCRPADADASLEQALRLAERTRDHQPELIAAARTFRDAARQRRLPAAMPALLSDGDRQRLDRELRRCGARARP